MRTAGYQADGILSVIKRRECPRSCNRGIAHLPLSSVGNDRLAPSPIDTTGNRSTSLYLSQLLDLPTSTVMLVAAIVLPLSFAWVTFPSSAAAGNRLQLWKAAWKKRLEDPYFCIGAGLLETFATSPLVWPHYFILGLIPAFWLFKDRRPLSLASIMGFLAILMMGGFLQRIYVIVGGVSGNAMMAARALAWTPLWMGMLINLRQNNSDRMIHQPAHTQNL